MVVSADHIVVGAAKLPPPYCAVCTVLVCSGYPPDTRSAPPPTGTQSAACSPDDGPNAPQYEPLSPLADLLISARCGPVCVMVAGDRRCWAATGHSGTCSASADETNVGATFSQAVGRREQM